MSVYLGQLGRMAELKCPASQQVQAEDLISFGTTLGGRRKAQVVPGSPSRMWSAQLSDASTPDQVGAVMSFINGEWGNGPFIWVSADAPVTNMLSPRVSACDPAEKWGVVGMGAPLLVGGAWAGRSYVANGSPNIFFGTQAPGASAPGERVPVIPGQPVTGSVHLVGAGAYCRVAFYTAADVLISQFNSTVLGNAGTATRSWVTALAPANAVSCRVLAIGATQAARPALTWSDTLLPWADGQGCPKAVIHGASRDLVMASRDPRGGRYANLSFTITEVG